MKKDNKEITVFINFFFTNLHECKENKKALTYLQALDLTTHKDSMLREINDLDTYHEVVAQLASLLVELSNKVTQADIEKVKSNHSSKTKFKVCEDLKKKCKCKDKKNCQAVQFQRCFTEDYCN